MTIRDARRVLVFLIINNALEPKLKANMDSLNTP